MVDLGNVTQKPTDLILEKEKGVNRAPIIEENLIIGIEIGT